MSIRPQLAPISYPALVDDFLLDEEFDIFEAAPPYSRKLDSGRLTLVCGKVLLDEQDNDHMESL